MKASNRLHLIPSSPIRKLIPFSQAATKRGIKVYHLNIGDPDIKSPQVVIKALKHWKQNPIKYGQSKGEGVMLSALTKYYHDLGFTFVHEDQIQITSGGSEAISMAMFSVANPGDEIIVFEPLYTNYNSYAGINEVRLIPITTDIKKGFHLPKRKDIEKKITRKTRAILYCSPNNPTGTVYTREEVEMLVAIAKKHKLFLLSDEVYREFTFDKRKQVSLFSYMQQIPNLAIVLDSMSKRYSLCGVRLGALVSLNKDIMDGVLRIAQGRLSAGFVDQHITAQISHIKPFYIESVKDEYEKRRNVLYEGLSKIPGIVIPKSEGAFYAIVGLPVKNAEHFCQWLLTDFSDKKETVMLAPAAGFYAAKGKGANEVRIAYVLKTKDLERCVELLAKAIRVYNTN